MYAITGRIIAGHIEDNKIYACIMHPNGYAEIYRVTKSGHLALMLGWTGTPPAEYRDHNVTIERNARGHLTRARPVTIGDVNPVTLVA